MAKSYNHVGNRNEMSGKKTEKRSVSLSITALAEIQRRCPGRKDDYFCAPTGISPVIDRDLIRLYGLYNEIRPDILRDFKDSELEFMTDVWSTHGESKKGPAMTRNLLASALSTSGRAALAERIGVLDSVSVYALVDILEERAVLQPDVEKSAAI